MYKVSETVDQVFVWGQIRKRTL